MLTLARVAVALALLLPGAVTAQVQQTVLFPGLEGQPLLDAIRTSYRPASTLGYDAARDAFMSWEQQYAGRLAVLQEEVGRHLGGALSLSGVEAGLQTVGWLAHGLDAEAVTERAAALGVRVVPVSRYAARPLVRDGLRLGFASVGEGQIRWGVEQLARAVDSLPGAPNNRARPGHGGV